MRGAARARAGALALALTAYGAGLGGCRHPPPKPVDDALELSSPAPPKPSASVSATPAPKPRPPTESGYERWRIALETYAPKAKPGAVVPLKAEGEEAFAKYIRSAHDKVHPIFTEALIPLDDAPDHAAIKNDALAVEIEIAIDGASGKIHKMGVVRRSEVVDLDTLALDAIAAAAPFAPAPERLRSPDGNVYLRWTFRRGSDDACAPRGVRGFVLRKAPWPP